MTSKNGHHTNAILRYATVATGLMVAFPLIYGHINMKPVPWYAFEVGIQNFFYAVIFIGGNVWFMTNAFRWLQERLPSPTNHFVFGAIAAAAVGFAAYLFIDNLAYPPESADESLFNAIFAASCIAAAIVAIASAARKPVTTEPVSIGMIMNGDEFAPGAPSTALGYAARWFAILGGIAFAISLSATLIVIPVAIALTCLVRWSCALDTHQMGQALTIIGAASVVSIAIGATAGFMPTETTPLIIGLLPAFVLFIAASMMGFVDRVFPIRYYTYQPRKSSYPNQPQTG